MCKETRERNTEAERGRKLADDRGREGVREAVGFDDNNFVQQVHYRSAAPSLFAKHRVLARLKFLAKQTTSSSICDQNYVYLLK